MSEQHNHQSFNEELRKHVTDTCRLISIFPMNQMEDPDIGRVIGANFSDLKTVVAMADQQDICVPKKTRDLLKRIEEIYKRREEGYFAKDGEIVLPSSFHAFTTEVRSKC